MSKINFIFNKGLTNEIIQNNIFVTTRDNISDPSTNIIDSSLNTFIRTTTGIGEQVDVSLNTPIDLSNIQAINVFPKSILSKNPNINKIRYETTKNVSLQFNEIQIWKDNSNILSGYETILFNNLVNPSFEEPNLSNYLSSTNSYIDTKNVHNIDVSSSLPGWTTDDFILLRGNDTYFGNQNISYGDQILGLWKNQDISKNLIQLEYNKSYNLDFYNHKQLDTSDSEIAISFEPKPLSNLSSVNSPTHSFDFRTNEIFTEDFSFNKIMYHRYDFLDSSPGWKTERCLLNAKEIQIWVGNNNVALNANTGGGSAKGPNHGNVINNNLTDSWLSNYPETTDTGQWFYEGQSQYISIDLSSSEYLKDLESIVFYNDFNTELERERIQYTVISLWDDSEKIIYNYKINDASGSNAPHYFRLDGPAISNVTTFSNTPSVTNIIGGSASNLRIANIPQSNLTRRYIKDLSSNSNLRATLYNDTQTSLEGAYLDGSMNYIGIDAFELSTTTCSIEWYGYFPPQPSSQIKVGNFLYMSSNDRGGSWEKLKLNNRHGGLGVSRHDAHYGSGGAATYSHIEAGYNGDRYGHLVFTQNVYNNLIKFRVYLDGQLIDEEDKSFSTLSNQSLFIYIYLGRQIFTNKIHFLLNGISLPTDSRYNEMPMIGNYKYVNFWNNHELSISDVSELYQNVNISNKESTQTIYKSISNSTPIVNSTPFIPSDSSLNIKIENGSLKSDSIIWLDNLTCYQTIGTFTDNNINTYHTISQQLGSYLDLDITTFNLNYQDIQSIVIYNYDNGGYDISNQEASKIILYDENNIPIIEYKNNLIGDTSYNIYKYKGPNHDSAIESQIQKIKIETTDYTELKLDEVQVMVNNDNVVANEKFQDQVLDTLVATKSVTMPSNYNGGLMNFPQSIFNGAMGSNTKTVSGLTGNLALFNGSYSITWSPNHTVPYSNEPAHYMFSATDSNSQYGDQDTCQFRYLNENVPYNSNGIYTGSNYLTYQDDNGNSINANGEWFALEFPAYINFTKVHHITLEAQVNTFTWIGQDKNGTNRLLGTYSMSWNDGWWRSATITNNYYVNKIYLVITKRRIDNPMEYMRVNEIFFDGNYEVSPTQTIYPNNSIVTASSTNGTDISSNIVDSKFNTYFLSEKGIGEFIDVSLNTPVNFNDIQSILLSSSPINTNPIISKIKYETTSNVKLELNNFQVWVNSSNISNQITNHLSSKSGTDLSNVYDSNKNSYYLSDQGVGEYIQFDLSDLSFNYNDLEAIITYNYGLGLNDLSNQQSTKLTLYDDSNIPVIEYSNSLDGNNYTVYKYKGPGYSQDQLRNIRITTTDYTYLDINEIQVWSDQSNLLQNGNYTLTIKDSSENTYNSSLFTDASFNTIYNLEKGTGHYIDISLNNTIDVSKLESVVIYSDIKNTTNPNINKIRFETTKNVPLQFNEIQLWKDNSNILSGYENISFINLVNPSFEEPNLSNYLSSTNSYIDTKNVHNIDVSSSLPGWTTDDFILLRGNDTYFGNQNISYGDQILGLWKNQDISKNLIQLEYNKSYNLDFYNHKQLDTSDSEIAISFEPKPLSNLSSVNSPTHSFDFRTNEIFTEDFSFNKIMYHRYDFLDSSPGWKTERCLLNAKEIQIWVGNNNVALNANTGGGSAKGPNHGNVINNNLTDSWLSNYPETTDTGQWFYEGQSQYISIDLSSSEYLKDLESIVFYNDFNTELERERIQYTVISLWDDSEKIIYNYKINDASGSNAPHYFRLDGPAISNVTTFSNTPSVTNIIGGSASNLRIANIPQSNLTRRYIKDLSSNSNLRATLYNDTQTSLEGAYLDGSMNYIGIDAFELSTTTCSIEWYGYFPPQPSSQIKVGNFLYMSSNDRGGSWEKLKLNNRHGGLGVSRHDAHYGSGGAATYSHIEAGYNGDRYGHLVFTQNVYNNLIKFRVYLDGQLIDEEDKSFSTLSNQSLFIYIYLGRQIFTNKIHFLLNGISLPTDSRYNEMPMIGNYKYVNFWNNHELSISDVSELYQNVNISNKESTQTIYKSISNSTPIVNSTPFIPSDSSLNIKIENGSLKSDSIIWLDNLTCYQTIGTFTDNNINTYHTISQQLGSYLDLDITTFNLNYQDIQSIVTFNYGNGDYDLSNQYATKLILYDESNIPFIEYDNQDYINGVSSNYNVYKYKGPVHDTSIRGLKRIKFETETSVDLGINEIQVWKNNENVFKYDQEPTSSFILNGDSKSLTDLYSSNSLTLNGTPGFDYDGVHLIGSQYITIPQSILGFGTDNFTISLWTQTTVASGTPHIMSLGYNNSNSWLLESNGSIIQLYGYQQTSSGDGDTDFNFTADNQTNNYIISRVGSKMKLFINGILKLDLDISVSLPSQDYHIGYSLINGSYYSGIIKRLDIWKNYGFSS